MAIGIAVISIGAFAVFLLQYIMREGTKAQRMQCRGCGRKGKVYTATCPECGIEEPVRDERNQDLEDLDGDHLLKD